MPLIHIQLRAGKPEAYRQAILDSLYRALREALNVPEGDHFMTITEHDAANFRCGNAYGVARSDDVVYIQITVFNSRTVEQKKALFRRIAAWLGDKDLACEQLALAVELPGTVSYGQLKLLPYWDPLRGDPRFEKIVSSLAPKN